MTHRGRPAQQSAVHTPLLALAVLLVAQTRVVAAFKDNSPRAHYLRQRADDMKSQTIQRFGPYTTYGTDTDGSIVMPYCSNATGRLDYDPDRSPWHVTTPDTGFVAAQHHGGCVFRCKDATADDQCHDYSVYVTKIKYAYVVGGGFVAVYDLACEARQACISDACVNRECVGTQCIEEDVICTTTDPCNPRTCNPATGECEAHALTCDDGESCTQDLCVEGVCTWIGDPSACDDGNPCTRDFCTLTSGDEFDCEYENITCGAPDACTRAFCDPDTPGVCEEEPIDCDDGDPCTVDYCHTTQGCLTRYVSCDDGDPCTTDRCIGVTDTLYVCATTPEICSDDDPCTVDVCTIDDNGLSQCKHEDIHCGYEGWPCIDRRCVAVGIEAFECRASSRVSAECARNGTMCVVTPAAEGAGILTATAECVPRPDANDTAPPLLPRRITHLGSPVRNAGILVTIIMACSFFAASIIAIALFEWMARTGRGGSLPTGKYAHLSAHPSFLSGT